MIQNDIDRRRVFMRLTEKDRDAALYNLITDEIAERVKLVAEIVELRNDNEYFKRELEGISHRQQDTRPVSTQDRIRAALQAQNAPWYWYRDKVLPSTLATIQTALFLALLYLAFGNKLP